MLVVRCDRNDVYLTQLHLCTLPFNLNSGKTGTKGSGFYSCLCG